MKIYFWIILICGGLFFCSTEEGRGIYQNKSLNQQGWNKDSSVVFNFEIEDTNMSYNIYLDLRNDDKYPYSNIFLFTEIVQDTNIVRQDTLQYIMASPDGRWLGRGITDVKKSIFIYDTNLKFTKKDSYSIIIKQGMRKDDLEGILSIGFMLEKI